MNQDHIIQKIFVEITVSSKEKAERIREDISNFLSIDVFPEIEKYIEALEHQLSGQTLQIPKLELNLDIKNSALDTELRDTIVQQLKEELSGMAKSVLSQEPEKAEPAEGYLVGNQEKMIRTFIYFLEHGSMPWWNPDSKGLNFLESAVFKNLISTDIFPKSILPVLSRQQVQDRMIHQLTDTQLAELCSVILKNDTSKFNLEAEIIRSISRLNFPDRMMVWHLLLDVISEYAVLSDRNLQESLVLQLEKAISTGSPQQKECLHKNLKTIIKLFPLIKEKEIEKKISESLTTNQPASQEHTGPSLETVQQEDSTVQEEAIPDDGQYMLNAGLILIHPFIKTFFEHCDLLDPKTQQLLDPELGAHLLHYIATGKTNAPECDMVFEKFLCNIPVHQPISRHVKLSRKHKIQAKNVIESVQHNWNPMKNSSVALLQNEFFQRPGKLTATDYDYTLTVERKTQDILLDKLAWGIGLVKLPWKEKFMYVNW
ncbi:contractile injection system tape measure protein [uncultured Chryseobacterium sp.]|uniref:contractile injection system tape measure protein n=1 Tax=uncultured Chryseobacterium sp. TaxID=259322 RepID=UPI0025D88E83|nr:contractile injection system tape measure protein [uncultured Chryseobacterium sp.]